MEYININRQGRYIKDNGKMIYGMEKANINLLIIKYLSKEYGLMGYWMAKIFKLYIKMDNILKVNIIIIKRMDLVI